MCTYPNLLIQPTELVFKGFPLSHYTMYHFEHFSMSFSDFIHNSVHVTFWLLGGGGGAARPPRAEVQ